jgi:hypothetical protein
MLLKALSDRRVRNEALHEALELAAYELGAGADDLFSLLPPVDSATFSERVATLARSGRSERVARLVETRAAGILLQSALAPERAAFWDAASTEWLISSVPPPEPSLRRFSIELLMATGRRDEAARQILTWLDEIPGPQPAWLVQRACEIDRGSLCDTALEDAATRSREPFLERLRLLRAEGGETAPVASR